MAVHFPKLNSTQSANIADGIDQAAGAILQGKDPKKVSDKMADKVLEWVNSDDARNVGKNHTDGEVRGDKVEGEYADKLKELVRKLVISADRGTLNADEINTLARMPGFNMVKETLTDILTNDKEGEFWYGDDFRDVLKNIHIAPDAVDIVGKFESADE